MARILSYGESTPAALLHIKVLEAVRELFHTFRLNCHKTSAGTNPIAPIREYPPRTRGSNLRINTDRRRRRSAPSPSGPVVSSHLVKRHHLARWTVGRLA